MTTDFRKQVEALLPLAGTGVEYRVAYTDESAAQLVDAIVKLHEAEVERVIGLDEDDRYEDEDGEMHDGMRPIVQGFDEAIDAETRNELRAEQRQRAAIEPKKEGE